MPEAEDWRIMVIPGPQPPTERELEEAAERTMKLVREIAALFEKVDKAPLLWEGDNA